MKMAKCGCWEDVLYWSRAIRHNWLHSLGQKGGGLLWEKNPGSMAASKLRLQAVTPKGGL